MKKYNKKIYLCCLIFSFIICSPLLRMHMASDTYNFMYLGYFDYPKYYFLRDARIISALCSYLGGIFKLNYSTFIIIMEILAVIISSFSIYLLYNTIVQKINKKNEINKDKKISLKHIAILLGSTLVVFNCMSIEYLLYVESAVMCLSVLCSIIGARIYTSNTKNKFIKTLLVMICAIFCYQGSINIFITLVTMFLLMENSSSNFKKIIKEIFFAGIICIIIFVISALIIFLNNQLLGFSQNRIDLNEKETFVNWFIRIFRIIKNILIYNFQLWPIMFIPVIILITILFLSYTKQNIINIIKYLCIIFMAIISCALPTYFMERACLEPRTSMSIGAIVGISMIFLIYNINEEKYLDKIVFSIISLLVVFNSMNIISIFTYHIQTNKFDKDMAIKIENEIEKYEKDTGKIINKIAYCFDSKTIDYPEFMKHKYSSFTQRAFNNVRCLREALAYYSGRDFKVVKMDKETYNYFKNKNWDCFSNEQLIFKDNILNICIY